MRAKSWYICTECNYPIGPGDSIRKTSGGYRHWNCARVKEAIKRRDEEVIQTAARESAR